MRARMTAAALVAGVLIGVLAGLPAPPLTVSRAPEVVPKHTPPGDVRAISLATDGPYVQAALEVFDGTDWEAYYWTDVPGLTPQASAITSDIVEQRWVRIAAGGGRLLVGWIESTETSSAIRMTSKQLRGYRFSWTPAQTLTSVPAGLEGLAVALTPDAKTVAAFVRDGDVWVTWPPGSATAEMIATGGANPSVAVAGDGAVAVAFERGGDIAFTQNTGTGWSPSQSARGGRRPHVLPGNGGWRIAYTEGGGSSARVVVRSQPGGEVRRYPTRLGTGAPAAITFLGDEPMAGYLTIEEKRQIGWIALPARAALRIPVPVARRASPSPG